MAVRLRLKRMGAKHRPFYRIIVADSRSPRDGRRLDEIGYYDPRQQPSRVVFHEDKLTAWLRQGARPSATVAQLMKQSGVPRAIEAETGETS